MQTKYPTTPTKELTLDNGMTIIVAELSGTTEAHIELNYKVSHCNETPESAGINLMLASVLLQDNQDIALPDSHELNSFHRDDFTSYIQQVLPSSLNEAFSQYAIMMATPQITDESLQSGIQLRNSYRAEADVFISNYSTPQEIKELLYPFSSYSNMADGTPASLSSLDIHQLHQWHQRWYMPNNATLVVVGNVSAANVFELAEQHFSAIPHRPLEAFNHLKVTSEPGKRHIELRKKTKEPFAVTGFNLPDRNFFNEDPKAFGALGILAELLTNYFLLIPDGWGVAGVRNYENAGLFYLSVTALSADQTPSQLEQGLHTYISELKRNPIDTQTLEQAREKTLALWAKDEQDPLTLPSIVTTYHHSKLPLSNRAQEYQALLGVTAKDIQDFANTYFTEQRMTTAHIFPLEGSLE
ncbi:Peptidase M16 inactive domain protein [compost metagenome]